MKSDKDERGWCAAFFAPDGNFILAGPLWGSEESDFVNAQQDVLRICEYLSAKQLAMGILLMLTKEEHVVLLGEQTAEVIPITEVRRVNLA
ncbi:MAG: hypothetical protein WD850_01695 [Candidatus Spechtbacterales bacterium]